MKKIIIIILITVISISVHGQTTSFDWVKGMGGFTNDEGYSISIDSNKNVYTTGSFSGNADFNPGAGTYTLSSAGSLDAFISKLDSSGNFVWAVRLGGTGSDVGRGIDVDNSGNTYITGEFTGTVDFDPGPGIFNLTSSGGLDVFVLKLDALGNYVWAKKMGGNSADEGYGLVLGNSGNIYITGNYYNTGTFGIYNVTSAGFSDVFVSKLNNSGTILWVKSAGGTQDDYATGITLDYAENVLTTGHFWSLADFNPIGGSHFLNPYGSGTPDIFVLKQNSSGVFQWVKQLGGTLADFPNAIASDAMGNVYTTGRFETVADFDPGVGTYNLYSLGAGDIFISKLDDAGNFIWCKSIGGADFEAGRGINVDTLGNVYVTGEYYSTTVDFDPAIGIYYNLGNNGNSDLFLLKLNQFGNFRWAKQMGGNGYDYGLAIILDKDRNIYSTGTFEDTVDFDPDAGNYNLYASGGDDIFVHKMAACQNTTYANFSSTVCNSFTYNSHVYTLSGNYMQNIMNSIGCDSIITFSLLVNDSTSSNIIQSVCDSFILNSQAYSATGTYYQTLPNATGCDSLITLFLTVQNNSGSLNSNSCDSALINGQTFVTTGLYDQTLTNILGCDSIVHLNIVINYSSELFMNATACSTYTLNSQTYSLTGIYSQTLINTVGCDSNITLNLTIANTSSSITDTACSSYFFDGVTYTSSGIYGYYYINAAGCDSIVTLNLTINYSNSSLTAANCDQIIVNGETFTNGGTYTQTLTTAAGCDSIITLNLTVYNEDTVVIQNGASLMANATGATYQWINCAGNTPISGATGQNFIASANGSYAVIVTQNTCSDTSACYIVTNAGLGDNESNIGISVFPNPTDGFITISVNSILLNANIKIISLTGQVVFQKSNLNGNNFTFDVNELRNGVYYIEIIHNDIVSRVKIIKY